MNQTRVKCEDVPGSDVPASLDALVVDVRESALVVLVAEAADVYVRMGKNADQRRQQETTKKLDVHSYFLFHGLGLLL
jgi:hypothetical protein